MENCLDKLASSEKDLPCSTHKTKNSLKLPGLKIKEHPGTFYFAPKHQYSEIFEMFHIRVENGITLYSTKKAILDKVIIPEGNTLGFLYAKVHIIE